MYGPPREIKNKLTKEERAALDAAVVAAVRTHGPARFAEVRVAVRRRQPVHPNGRDMDRVVDAALQRCRKRGEIKYQRGTGYIAGPNRPGWVVAYKKPGKES